MVTPTLDAIILSVDEPQLPRCLQSVHTQSPPFTNIIHINNISPESVAFTSGMSTSTADYITKINGDFILYPEAVATILSKISLDDGVGIYNFGLYDPFLRGFICGCSVLRREALDAVGYPDYLANDKWMQRKMQLRGWLKAPLYRGRAKRRVVIGTHFDTPDEFQIFRRFYTQGVKYGHRYGARLLRLHQDTSDPVYAYAMQALTFGVDRSYYPTSHNIHLDRELFEEFHAHYHPATTQQT